MISLSRERFEQGKTWDEFLAGMSQNKDRLLRVLEVVRPTEEEVEAARHAASRHQQPLSVLVLAEDWCPDAIVNIPVVVRFAEVVPDTEVRFFYRSENPDLEAAYAEDGVFSIPVISFFDARWREIARFVEHSAEAARRKAEWMAQHPEVTRLRNATSPEEREQYKQLMARRFVAIVRWYRGGLWRATWQDLIRLLEVDDQ